MRILLLCEGDAETHDSWSGVSRSLVMHFRGAGHTVTTCDVDLYGAQSGHVALRTLSFSRRRWWVRYHLGAAGFRARSARCAEAVRRHAADHDIILQVGATFRVPADTPIPVALYCDSNIELSRTAARSGFSEASVLTEREIARIHERESDVYARADFIFTMSDLVRRSFTADFGVPESRLLTIHCGPNIDPARIAPRNRSANGPPKIVFVGRDWDRKGGEVLLKAFRRVRERIPGARMTMIGPSRSRPPVDGVEFAGFLSRDTPEGAAAMTAAYDSATLFCLPTRFDPFGTSFVEAMINQLPCVGPDAWAIPEIIEHEQTGLLVPPEDPEALADALTRLLNDRALCLRMGAAGRASALERFAWPTLTGRMLSRMAEISGIAS